MVSHPINLATASASNSHDLTARRAPSITSTRTALTHRRHHHRHTRSHVGTTTSHQAQNEFPVFTHTGDVEIVLADREGRRETRFLLHRLILAQCSGFFEAGTSDEWSGSVASAGNTSGKGEGGRRISEDQRVRGDEVVLGGQRKRWLYQLDWGSGPDDVPMLVQKSAGARGILGHDPSARPPPPLNKPHPPSSGFFRSMANYSALHVSSKPSSGANSSHENDPYPDLVLSYSNLFRVFYNHPPALDAVNIANAYVESKQLLHLADLYDALSVIGPRIDHHLLRFHSRLWKQVAKYPPSYLKLGYLARSKAIYSEALVHVVGQWPAGAPQLRGQIPQALWELIEDKAAELHDVIMRVESRLFRLSLTTPRGDRVSPHSAWLDWLAVSLFRHWILDNLTPPPAPILKPSGPPVTESGRTASSASTARPRTSSRSILPTRHRNSSSSRSTATTAASRPAAPPPPFNISNSYAMLAAGGSAYLPHADVKAFLKLHPDTYSRENLRRFEKRVDELKNLAREVVRPLGRCWLEGDSPAPGAGDGERGWGWGYLVCVKVDEGDWVWDEE